MDFQKHFDPPQDETEKITRNLSSEVSLLRQEKRESWLMLWRRIALSERFPFSLPTGHLQ